MKPLPQRHPRLYFNILNKRCNDYEFEYYDNRYRSDGNRKVSSALIDSKLFSNSNSKKETLYKLNKIEFQLLDVLIKKQQKVMKIYLAKNKKDQYRIIESSLELLFDYRNNFLQWFNNNKII